jgi:uncharacterized membrane protein HdeD (DUF308 family)
MIRLLILLLGAEVVQRRWRLLLAIGALWAALGVAIMIDAFDGSTVVRPHYFGYLLLLEGIISLLAGMIATERRAQQLAKAVILLLPAVIIVAQPRHSNTLIAMLLGGVMLLDGSLRVASAWMVRFDAWRMAIGAGIVEIILAIITLEPWPTWYEGTIGFNVGALLIISGWGTALLANRLRMLPADAPISMLVGGAFPTALWIPAVPDDAGHDDLIVHVWTPKGPGRRARRRPLVDRYIAAVDASGTVSTGHAALELAPNVYISHYPAAEIDRSPDEFGRVLRAGAENDLPGLYQPSYAEEAAGWCEATEHVRFTAIDRVRVRHFWRAYRSDTTYNLTSRNCSTAVARALDAALEGILGQDERPWRAFFRALLTPELWVAGVLRRRAEAMAWTPGLILDYARLLQIVVEPQRAQGTTRWSRLRRLSFRRAALNHSRGTGEAV